MSDDAIYMPATEPEAVPVNTIAYISITSFAIFFMHTGIVLLEAGHCRTKNVKSFVYKVGLGLMLSVLVWWFWGYGFAVGNVAKNLMQFDGNMDGEGESSPIAWFWSVALVSLCTALVGGSVTDRLKVWPYALLIIALAGGAFPLIANWTTGIGEERATNFNGSGWFAKRGVVDWAGAGYIHLLAGITGAVGAWSVRPRAGRFVLSEGRLTVVETLPYDGLSTAAGTFILIFGFLNLLVSFSILNGQALGSDTLRVVVVALIAIASSGFNSILLLGLWRGHFAYSLPLLNNAVLGGAVAISAGAGVVNSMGAFFIGMGSALVAFVGPNMLVWMGIDDPRDVFTVHFLQAVWGLFAAGLWATDKYTTRNGAETSHYGAFYSGNGVLLGYQLVYIICITVVGFLIAFFAMCFACIVAKKVFIDDSETDPLSTDAEDDEHEVLASFPYFHCHRADAVAGGQQMPGSPASALASPKGTGGRGTNVYARSSFVTRSAGSGKYGDVGRSAAADPLASNTSGKGPASPAAAGAGAMAATEGSGRSALEIETNVRGVTLGQL